MSAVPTLERLDVQALRTVVSTYRDTVKAHSAIINRLNQEIVRALNRPEVKAKLLSAGVQTVGGTPGELASVMNSEIAKWRKVIKDAGIKAD